MAFFILIIFMIVWVFAMRKVSAASMKMIKTPTHTKQILLTFCLSIAPFAHELYVYFGFQAYCSVYGGSIIYEPVQADALADGLWGLNDVILMSYLPISRVQYVGNNPEKLREPYMALVSDVSACERGWHKRILTAPSPYFQSLAINMEKQNLCFAIVEGFEAPRYEIRNTPFRSNAYMSSQSGLYPRGIRENKSIELIDRENGEVKSKYIQLYTRPGFLAEFFIPMMDHYECPSSNSTLNIPTQFQDNTFAFLKQAILPKD